MNKYQPLWPINLRVSEQFYNGQICYSAANHRLPMQVLGRINCKNKVIVYYNGKQKAVDAHLLIPYHENHMRLYCQTNTVICLN